MTTALPINQQVNLNSLALETQDADLTGNLTVAGNATVTGNLTVTGTVTKTTPIVSLTTTAAPTAAQSGTTFLLNATGGFVVTLPTAPSLGTEYKFVVGTLTTSSSTYKILTPTSVYIVGTWPIFVTGALTSTTAWESFASLAGTTNRSITMTCATPTTGGATIGDCFTLTYYATGLWVLSSVQITGSGTLATPFATS